MAKQWLDKYQEDLNSKADNLIRSSSAFSRDVENQPVHLASKSTLIFTQSHRRLDYKVSLQLNFNLNMKDATPK